MNALFAFKGRYAVVAQRDGLAGAHGDAGLLHAGNAEPRVAEDDVVGKAGHGLHLAADQQSVLLRDQQAAIEGNLRPAAHREQGIMQRAPIFESHRNGLFQHEAVE